MKLRRFDLRMRGLEFVLACGACLAAPGARGDVIISNLDQPHAVTHNFPSAETTTGLLVGAAIMTGSIPVPIVNVVINEENFGPPPSPDGESFSIYSRNTDGTIGIQLFTNFTLAFTPTNTYGSNMHGGFETATATSPVTLAANTGYFLVLSENVPANQNLVAWDFTSSPTYTSNPTYGVTMPATRTTVFQNKDLSFGYADFTDGPQLFEVSVPEPSPLVLGGLVSGVAGVGYWWRHRRRPA